MVELSAKPMTHQELPLPGCEITVLVTKFGKIRAGNRCRLTAEPGVVPCDLVEQETERPAIGDRMVYERDQRPVVATQRHQPRPPQRGNIQDERGVNVRADDLPEPAISVRRGDIAQVRSA